MLQINTTQNVKLNFNLADVGYRLLAFLTDLVIIIIYVWMVFGVLDLGKLVESFDDHWSQIAMTTLIMLPVTVYTLVSEILMKGQTLGKKLLKIKVIKIDGFQASTTDFIIRWFFRTVDIYGFTVMWVLVAAFNLVFDGILMGFLSILISLSPIIGFITMVVSKNKQRFGDMIAGTTVVSLRNKTNISHTILEEINSDYVPTYAAVIKLSDNDARIIKETFIAAKKNKDYSILIKLRTKIEEVTGISNKERNDLVFIDTVLKDYNYYTQNM